MCFCQSVGYLSFLVRNVGNAFLFVAAGFLPLVLSRTLLHSHVLLSLDAPVSQRPVIKSTLNLQYFDKCDLPWYICAAAAAADALAPPFF